MKLAASNNVVEEYYSFNSLKLIFSTTLSILRGVPLFRTVIQRMNYASGDDCPTGACKRVRDKQEIFTVEDNCPVHLKGGSTDKILYGFTFGLALLGAGMSLIKLYQMS